MAETTPSSGMPLPQSMAGNFQDAVRWFNQMWSTGADPTAAARTAAGAMPSMMMPTLDVRELEKRLADLRSVEQWLQLNLGLLRTTIQALEMQRSGLMAWNSLGKSGGGAKPEAGAGAPDMSAFQPAAWWAALQQQFAQMAAHATAPEAAPAGAAAAAPADAPASPKASAKSGSKTGEPGPTPP